jgi:hypothetical protein
VPEAVAAVVSDLWDVDRGSRCGRGVYANGEICVPANDENPREDVWIGLSPQVFVSRILRVRGEVAERLKAAVC